MAGLDFKGLAAELLARSRDLLPHWLPEGRWEGAEYKIGSIGGEAGRSLSINSRTGVWKDFSGTDAGHDLISLYAAINGLDQGDAAKQLGVRGSMGNAGIARSAPPAPAPEPEAPLVAPPANEVLVSMFERLAHPRYGKPATYWTYHNERAAVIGYVARYDVGNGRKEIMPWRWEDRPDPISNRKGRWIAKSFPKPRLLYRLPALLADTEKRVLIVEGEKAADAAQRLLESYAVTTWSGGTEAARYADFSVLAGRSVDLWPDHDKHYPKNDKHAAEHGVEYGELLPYAAQPGRRAMEYVGTTLIALGCTVRIIEVGLDPKRKDGWDAADAEAEKLPVSDLMAWARPLIRAFEPDGTAAIAAPRRALKTRTPPASSVVATQPPQDAAAADATPEAPPPLTDADEPPETQPEAPAASGVMLWQALGLKCNTKGIPHPNTANAARVVQIHPMHSGRIWYDEFHRRVFVREDREILGRREWTEADDLSLTIWFQESMGMEKISKGQIADAVQHVAYQTVRNEPKEWLNGLEWDGTERLELLCENGFGARSTPFVQAVGRCFLMGMVARVLNPGTKVDAMPVFESVEGKNKSQALEIIGGQWYAEMSAAVGSKDFLQALQGKMLVEFADLASFGRSSIEELKAIITTRVDRYRGAYARRVEDYPRTAVFSGSTNRADWNKSDTGGRRFWPVRCGIVDLEWILGNRQQLFAEAVERLRRGEPWWDVPGDEHEAEVDDRREPEPWEGPIRAHLDRIKRGSEKPYVVVSELARDVLGLLLDRQDAKTSRRIGMILRGARWMEARRRNTEGTQFRCFEPMSAYTAARIDAIEAEPDLDPPV